MNKKTFEASKLELRAKRANSTRVAELKRKAQLGDFKARKQLEEEFPRTMNRADKRSIGVRSNAGHGRKKRRTLREYFGGQILSK